ncbi:MAG: AAA family ATPase [Bacteroidales bacterium]|nr:AAA family ATPase [Bacteroidales bacterium]
MEDIDENDVEIKSKTGIVFNNIEIKPNNNLKIIKGKKPLHVSYDDLLKVAKKFKPQQEFSTTDIRVFLNKGCHAHAYWAVLNHIYKNYWSEDNIKETKPTETIEKKKYFFIIDEINRGNLSKIFGELLMLIEDTHRGETINLAYSGEEFCVPENVYIIGMMNTADRSLAMIDYALRRRFSFFEMQPAFKNDKFTKIIKGENLEKVVEKIIELNNKICEDASLGKGFCIGHSYFCNLTDDNEETLQNIIDYEIAPMLKEYWFDDIQKYNKAIQPLKELFKNDNLQEHSN